jgi:hypothetical protein
MGATARGLRYPEATVLANTLHTQIKNLADDVQEEFDGLVIPAPTPQLTILSQGMDISSHLTAVASNTASDVTVWQVSGIGIPAGARIVKGGMEYRTRAGANAALYAKLLFNFGLGWIQLGLTRFHNSGDSYMAGTGLLQADYMVPAGATSFSMAINLNVDSGGVAFSTYPAGYSYTFYK